MFHRYRLALALIGLALAGCGGSAAGAGAGAVSSTTAAATVPKARPQAIEPSAGQQAQSVTPNDPVGDPNAHAEPLSEVRRLLRLEVIAVKANNATYIDPLQYVTVWERTDQGVDAQLPVGAPILAPCRVKILAIEPDWYAGQPLVYFELLDGPDAGKVQYVAEQITDIAPRGHDPPAGAGDRPLRLARHSDRVRLVDDQRRHARARDHGLRGGRDHAGGHHHARLAEQPWRERGALAPEVIKPR